MDTSRRTFLAGAAALSAAVVTPETAFAARAQGAAADWSLATADLAGDLAPRPMRLVQGRAPADLDGDLFRNGPAQFRRPGGSATHWFDGDGFVRRFRIAQGRAELAGRFVDTRKRRQEAAAGAMLMPGFGTLADPRAVIESPDDANAANTSVLPVGDAVWALWEAGSAVALDSETLATRGYVTHRPDLAAMPFLAHPRIEPDGRIWNLGLSGARAMVWRLAADGTLEDASLVELPRASYVHDFSASERHLVIVLQPWIHARHAMPLADGFEWRPDAGTQVLVIDKADLSVRRLYELPAFGFFHLGDAWAEPDGTLRFDVCALADMRFAASGARELLHGLPMDDAPARLALATLRPDGRAELQTTEIVAEFPRSDPRRAGRPRRLTTHTALEPADRPLARGLAVHDWGADRSTVFDLGPDQVAEEAVFVPKPGRSAETDAWLLAPSINLGEGVTELRLFEVADLAAGPVATWRADVALPAGFHGAWRGRA